MYKIKINIAADNAVGEPLYMEDWGLKIEFEGLTLPTAYEVHFSNNPASPAKMAIGDASGVVVPYEYTAKSGTLYGWLVFTNPSSGYTKRAFTVAITRRSPLDPPQVLPEQVTVIDTAIAALNAAIVATSANVAEAAASAENAAESATNAANSAAESAASAADAETAKEEAETAATNAETSATESAASATAASESATAAASSATAASGSAATAQAAATRAENAMDAARTSATNAAESAGLAQTAMEESADNAQAAAESASTASEAATSAGNSAGAALTHATNAAASATAAGEAQTAAETAAGTATEKAAEASESATDAAESAAEAEAAATRAEQTVTESEAWALGAYATSSASGAVATVDDGAEGVPVKSLTAYIVPMQEGSGDPSPDNVRPIHGFTGMNITANETVYPVTWSDEAGTVYGGYFDAVTGKLTVTMAAVDMGTLTWAYNKDSRPSAGGFFSAPVAGSVPYNCSYISTIYKTITDVTGLGNVINSYGANVNNVMFSSGNVATTTHYVVDSRFTTAAAFKAAVTGQTLVYELATPQTYQLTPLDVRTLRGVNNIFSDTGDVDATVRADPDLHINKLIAEAVALALENA